MIHICTQCDSLRLLIVLIRFEKSESIKKGLVTRKRFSLKESFIYTLQILRMRFVIIRIALLSYLINWSLGNVSAEATSRSYKVRPLLISLW